MSKYGNGQKLDDNKLIYGCGAAKPKGYARFSASPVGFIRPYAAATFFETTRNIDNAGQICAT